MPAPIVHFEIGCRDTAKTRTFYGKLFDWEFQDYGGTQMIANIGAGPDGKGGPGIGGHVSALGHEPHHYVTVYAQVDDLQATLDKATSLGGKVVVPPTEVPNMGHFAWFTDPDGNCMGLWKPMRHG
ncbi:MAG: VOC family protein [Phycisphaerales bacterium]|nr:VOC family protein [Phycisphaerales bacterium]